MKTKRIRGILSLALTLPLLTGCLNLVKGKALQPVEYPKNQVTAPPVPQALERPLESFSYKTASLLLRKNYNVTYSPLTLYQALAMAATGATGKARGELLNLLESDGDHLKDQVKQLFESLYDDEKPGHITFGNSLWLGKDKKQQVLTAPEAYTESLRTNFYATTHQVNFVSASDAFTMSHWVNQLTKGEASPEIIPSPLQALVFVHTAYLKERLSQDFALDENQDLFYLPKGGEKPAEFRYRVHKGAKYYQGKNYTRASLYFQQGAEWIIVLPNAETSTEELAATPELLQETFEGGRPMVGDIYWSLPKLKLNTPIRPKSDLQLLGVSEIFSSGKELTGIVNSPVTDILLQTAIKFEDQKPKEEKDEIPETFVNMVLNRPFLFMIKYKGQILYFGQIMESADA